MGFTLNQNSLYSRGIRFGIGNRSTGGNPLKTLLEKGKQIVQVLTFGNLKGFLIGFALSQIPSLVFSLTGLWSLFTDAAISLYYFDWNVPDDQLDRQAQQQWSAYGGVLGSTAGSAIGFFACGIVPATSLAVFDENLAAYVLREVGEEAFEEVTQQFSYALRLALRNLTRQTAGWLYKGARRLLKNPNNPILDLVFPGRADEIREKWGAANSPSFTFANAVDEQVEKIPSQFWQNFTEELIEEAIDACIEAGYVLANSIEGYYAQQRLTQQLTQDVERVVEVTPDRSNDSEKIVLAGPESELRGQIPAVLATHQMIGDRDVGQFVGKEVNDYLRASPYDGLRLEFTLYSVQSPPYVRRGSQRLVEVNVSVSDIPRAVLDWDRLRLACGGSNGYLWGRFMALARLDNGRTIKVYGATEDEAVDRLRAFNTLSTAEIKTISVTEELREAERLVNPRLQKEATRVYPAYVSILNRQRTLAYDQGRGSRNGNFVDKKARFDLWRQLKPPDFEERVIELLRFQGV